MTASFGWVQIVRLGLAQTALGAIVVLMTSTLNRVMAVELALPALIPGLLVALHHAVQLARPRWGFGSDRGGRRTPWIVGGMAVLALGGAGAAAATALMAVDATLGTLLAVIAFTAIGIGVGAAGTNILVLLAQNVGEGRRAAAATIVWVMMIAGFVVTGATAGYFLDPFSLTRLVAVCGAVSALAFLLAVAATWRLEPSARPGMTTETSAPPVSFSVALATVWADAQARRFTIFVFVSMLAYSMQDLILEPFAGVVFGMTPGETTRLAGLQNAGTLSGMIGVALMSGTFGEAATGLLKRWIVAGCLASAAALGAIALGGTAGAGFPIKVAVFALGLANGAFATAAIASMMGLAGRGDPATRGVRMGLWGAAQAIGFGFGGLTGAVLADAARAAMAADAAGYALVFALEAALFLGCAALATKLEGQSATSRAPSPLAGEGKGEGSSGTSSAVAGWTRRPLIRRPAIAAGHLLPQGEKGRAAVAAVRSAAPFLSTAHEATP